MSILGLEFSEDEIAFAVAMTLSIVLILAGVGMGLLKPREDGKDEPW